MGDSDETKAAGGRARAAKLSPQERSTIASTAAKARWDEAKAARADAEGVPRVLKGFSSTLDLAGTRIPCAVINGPNGIQRVLSEQGITFAVLGAGSGASWRRKQAAAKEGTLLPLFVAPDQLTPYIEESFRKGALQPIDYLDGERVVRAYDASILTGVCNVWLRARRDGKLQDQQLSKAQKAEDLLSALAETGIVALIDEVTGYEKERPQNALQEYLKLVISEQLATWVRRFPDEFFMNIYKLKHWHWPGMQKNRYPVVGHYINDLVYDRLGPGVREELARKSPKNEKGQRTNKLHQWLTDDMGHPLLAQHIHTLLMFQRVAIANGHSWNRFVHTVNMAMPKPNANFELPLEEKLDPPEETPPPRKRKTKKAAMAGQGTSPPA